MSLGETVRTRVPIEQAFDVVGNGGTGVTHDSNRSRHDSKDSRFRNAVAGLLREASPRNPIPARVYLREDERWATRIQGNVYYADNDELMFEPEPAVVVFHGTDDVLAVYV